MSNHVDWLTDDDPRSDEDDGSFEIYDGDDNCPYCGGMLGYSGFEDGGGPYGNSVCEVYVCVDCDYAEERNCVEIDEGE